MIKSIKYFEENCIKKFEKLENDFLREPSKIAEYVLSLTDELHNLGLRMIQESLELMDEMFQESLYRKVERRKSYKETVNYITWSSDI